MGDAAANSGGGRIEVRLRELSQLFDSFDPSPFFEKDLDPKAEQYILDSYEELSPGTVREVVVHLDRAPESPGAEHTVADAIHDHFARQSARSRREFRSLLRRGVLSFAIGLVFLGAVYLLMLELGQRLGDSRATPLIEQGLLIVGWVAMWRPLEIFLYDW